MFRKQRTFNQVLPRASPLLSITTGGQCLAFMPGRAVGAVPGWGHRRRPAGGEADDVTHYVLRLAIDVEVKPAEILAQDAQGQQLNPSQQQYRSMIDA